MDWKNIEGFEGLYMVSEFGHVKALSYNKTNAEKNLIPKANHRGYLQIWLSKNGKVSVKTMHRLVASAFHGNSDKEVNHKDGNKLNNHYSNLEWVTKSQNMQHAYDNNLMNGVISSIIKAQSRLVLDKSTGIFYDSIKEASGSLNMDYSRLMNMISGHQKNKTNLIYA
jgi:hypothetical protein